MLTLIAMLLIKHWLADFPWQSQWMVANKARGGAAMLAHGAVHAGLSAVVLATWAACTSASERLWLLALLCVVMEFYAHCIIDVFKAHPRWGGRWTPAQPRFWTMLGLDQLAHHLTYVLMVWLLST